MYKRFVVCGLILVLLLVACTRSSTETPDPAQNPVPAIPEITQESTPKALTQVPATSETTQESVPTTPIEEQVEIESWDCGSEPIFTVSPVDIGSIQSVVTLGGLNPPGHVFPSDHGGFYIAPTNHNDPEPTNLLTFYSPGNLTVISIRADEHVTAGFTDYSITLKPCKDITVIFGHLTSLSEDVFGDTSSYGEWEYSNEYSTGGETYRINRKWTEIPVTAGQVLGTVGGRPYAWSFDFGVYDQRYSPAKVANPQRWENNDLYLHGVCYLSYYEEGLVLDQLVALVDRDTVEGETLPCGSVIQDISGTAQGIWFLSGANDTHPEDQHLALVRLSTNPDQKVLSIGTSIPNIDSGVYEFVPINQGLLNRDFLNIIPDGKIYGFQVNKVWNDLLNGVIIVMMPNAETLWIEVLLGATTEPTSWAFTEDKAVFER